MAETEQATSVPAWKRRSGAFQGVAAAVLLALGAWQGLAALSTTSAQNRLRTVMTWPSLLEGRTTGAVNYVLAHLLPADGMLRAAGGVLRWGIFDSGGPQLRVGCDDWLYLTEELRPWPAAEANMATRAAAIGRIASRLAQRDIAVVVAVVPDKARRHAEHLCGAPRSAQAIARYDAFLTALRPQPVTVVPLLAAMQRQDPAFWRTDTHWNQPGAAAAADAIAAAVGAVTPALPLTRGEQFATISADTETNGPGDLLRLMSLDQMPDWIASWARPKPDRQMVESTSAVGGGAAAGGGGGLLDETPAPEVVLLGSSYSLNANFHGRLQQALESTVVNYGQAGGAFSGAAAAYFDSEAFRDTPPKLVIWEMPERALVQPISDMDRKLFALFD
ncbi:alginate O-acetyltransferase AlgX-related protein [Roseomonas sp. 18066]|uniref:alginate O-acetyltransferase AlgX-related protein n=1 Tax=Roseomonas sp. 18066 TaxID=2681412 RepID=UPI00135712F7|nr:cell division protein FtsQ [Roseomonas sp. 18066]